MPLSLACFQIVLLIPTQIVNFPVYAIVPGIAESTTHILSYDQFWNQTNDSFQRNRSKLLLHFSTSHYVSQINYLLFIKLSCKYKQMTRWFWSNFKLMPRATYKRVLVFHSLANKSNFLSQCSFHKYQLVPTKQF